MNKRRHIVAYLEGLQAKVNALPAHAFGRLQSPPLHFGGASQSASGEELSALMPSILDEVFKGKL